MEIWKDIEGFEGLYQVSNKGRVKSLERELIYINGRRHLYKETILKSIRQNTGYYTVTLHKDRVANIKFVHRLVAQAFLPNPQSLPQVNHKDEDPSNNKLENLEWCSASYNMNYGTIKQRLRERELNHPKLSKAVCQYTLDGELVATYPSAMEAMRQGGFHRGHIDECCNRSKYYKTHKGFIWRFKD